MVWMLRRVVETATGWKILVLVMDCDVAATFDHVSHHGIIEATLAMGVPPMLIAAWIRECRNSKTIAKVDDIVTPRNRRTRSVPQGEPCAADFLEQPWARHPAKFCDVCQHKMVFARLRARIPFPATIWDPFSNVRHTDTCIYTSSPFLHFHSNLTLFDLIR